MLLADLHPVLIVIRNTSDRPGHGQRAKYSCITVYIPEADTKVDECTGGRGKATEQTGLFKGTSDEEHQITIPASVKKTHLYTSKKKRKG